VNDELSHFFYSLTPEKILEAVESTGLRCSGRCLTLNSMENRVYEVELELSDQEIEALTSRSERFRIVKFYRPGRWTREQIEEEHQFLFDLEQADIPVISPLKTSSGDSVSELPGLGIYFTVFPKCGGRSPDELSDEQLLWLGRLLARMHIVGASREARSRITISPESYGRQSVQILKQKRVVPLEFETSYFRTVEQAIELIEPLFKNLAIHRVHGDCHFGNILWGDLGPFFVDFDDMVNGPAVQDMWLITGGRDQETVRQRNLLFEGYEQIRHFDRSSARLIEPLRFLRMTHFNAWIAKRWEDPAFQRSFPYFPSNNHWSSETAAAEEMLRIIREL
jgi:Ser/Thr protein kinase RdoA (MazF antagonist)